jgi:hypothetical protein
MRAFAGPEDCSLLREPTPEFFARHISSLNNIVYIGKSRWPQGLLAGGSDRLLKCPACAASRETPCGGRRWGMLVGVLRLRDCLRFAKQSLRSG